MSRSSIKGVPEPTPQADRRHRPRDETRAIILDAATRVAIARADAGEDNAHNPLAGIRITDVLKEVNRPEDQVEGIKPMTTGAFYQIWGDQAAFQVELLAHVMKEVSTSGVEELESLAFELVTQGLPAEQVLLRVIESGFAASQGSPGLLLTIGLSALAPVAMIRDGQETSNRTYVEVLGRLLGNLLRYAGRSLRGERSMEDLVWAVEALTVGYSLQARIDPDRFAHDAAESSARSRATLGVILAFTLPD